MEAIRVRLDGALGILSWWGAALPVAVGWGYKFFTVPSNPSHSMILHFYDISTGLTQPWCSVSQELQAMGSCHPESQSCEFTVPRPMAVLCCAVSSQGLAATLSCAAGFAL